MAAPTNDVNTVLTSGNWIIQYGLERGVRVTSGLWTAKQRGWAAPGELGGFVGQGGRPGGYGSPPRGPGFDLWEFDPDGQIEILDGEMRVERAKPLNFSAGVVTGGRITLPAVSAFKGGSTWPTYLDLTGMVDARNMIGASVASPNTSRLRWNVTGDLIMHHSADMSINSASGTTHNQYGTVSGWVDLSYYKGETFRVPATGWYKWQSVNLYSSNVVNFGGGFRGDVFLFRSRRLRRIYADTNVGGDLDLTDCGPFTIDAPSTPGNPWLTVGGDLVLWGSSIRELPPIVSVGGDVDLRETRFATVELPGTWIIGGRVIR